MLRTPTRRSKSLMMALALAAGAATMGGPAAPADGQTLTPTTCFLLVCTGHICAVYKVPCPTELPPPPPPSE